MATVIGLPALLAGDTQAQEALQIDPQEITKTAYIVVRYGDNDVVVRRINFTGIISGWRALELAGLNPSGPDPSSLASINGYGNPDGDPFGTVSTRFWGTSHISGTTWAFNAWGVAEPKISENGHVEGFSWSDPGYAGIDPPPPMGIVAAADGLQWLRGQQSGTDGGYGNASKSIETLLAVGANGCDPAQWRNGTGNPSLLTYLSADRVAAYAGDAAGAGKAVVALAAAQQIVTNYLGLNLVVSITTHYSDTQGSYSTEPGEQAWAMMGLVAGRETVPVTAANYLTGLMRAGGCWAWGSDPAWYPNCDTNGTALAVQALLASGVPTDNIAVVSGTTWLKSAQNSDGGFPYDPQSAWGTASDTNSTAYVLQALLAAQQNLSMLMYGTPVDYLLSMQQVSGQFYWQGSSPGMDAQSPTRQAILPLLDRPLPTSSVAGLTTCNVSEKYNLCYLPLISKN
ncbi:MAG: hypothetical protein JW953_21140 [Anaerolineae bacterium]|nr:hypothetical protein [Anaerolineae bacterium]